MDFDEAIAGLPATYAEALRLRRRGLASTDIAARLAVPPESIEVLMQLAEAKLAALLPDAPDWPGPADGPGQ